MFDKFSFQVFLLVVVLGLFHSLCVLPVMLSLVGPPSYKVTREKATNVFSVLNELNREYQTGKTTEMNANNVEVTYEMERTCDMY